MIARLVPDSAVAAPKVADYLAAALGEQRFSSISSALCMPPTSTCVRVNTLRASPQEVLEHVMSNAAPVATEVQRLLSHADGGQGQDAQQPPQSPQQQPQQRQPYIHPQVPAVIMPGRGPLEVDYSVTKGKEVVVSRKAGEAVLRGAPVYIPGVLAASSGLEAGDLVAVSMVMERPGSNNSGVTRGTTVGSDAWRRAGPPDRTGLYLGVGRSHVGRTEMFRVDKGLAVTMERPVFSVPSCSGLEGKVMLQNLPSVVAAAVLAPAPGSRVLDMCAAPGGKTTLLAQLMQDRGEVVALDRSHAKVAEIESLAAELGMTIIKALRMDATKAVLRTTAGRRQQQQQQQQDQQGQQQPQQPQQKHLQQNGQCQMGEHGASVPSGSVQGNGLDKQQRASAGKDEAGAGDDGPTSTEHRGKNGELEGGTGVQAEVGNGETEEEREARGRDKAQRRRERKEAAAAARGVQLPQAPEAGPAHPGFPPDSFDHVLVDAPCSALGLRPRLMQTATMPYLHMSADYQRRILDAAVVLLKPEGTMVYSTCTINPGENEANVRYVLDKYPYMQLVQQSPRLAGPGLVGHYAGPLHVTADTEPRKSPCQPQQQEDNNGEPSEGQRSQERQGGAQGQERSAVQGQERSAVQEVWLTEAEASMVQRFDPAGETIGFFVAKFKKNS